MPGHEVQDELVVPVPSSGEAGDWADVSVAILGQDSPVTEEFNKLAETESFDTELPVVVIEGEDARLVHESLVARLRAFSFPLPDSKTREEHANVRHLVFNSDFIPADDPRHEAA